MNISAINSVNTGFKGLLTVSGPDKNQAITINTDNISTINPTRYFDIRKGFTLTDGSIIMMNSGASVNTYVPRNVAADAYAKAKKEEQFNLETPYNPVLTKGFFA